MWPGTLHQAPFFTGRKTEPWARRYLAKVAQNWAWDRHGHAQPGLLLLHGVPGMGEEDRVTTM